MRPGRLPAAAAAALHGGWGTQVRPGALRGGGGRRRGTQAPVVAIPGGGVYFYWAAGAVEALLERYRLAGCKWVGARCGPEEEEEREVPGGARPCDLPECDLPLGPVH